MIHQKDGIFAYELKIQFKAAEAAERQRKEDIEEEKIQIKEAVIAKIDYEDTERQRIDEGERIKMQS